MTLNLSRNISRSFLRLIIFKFVWFIISGRRMGPKWGNHIIYYIWIHVCTLMSGRWIFHYLTIKKIILLYFIFLCMNREILLIYVQPYDQVQFQLCPQTTAYMIYKVHVYWIKNIHVSTKKTDENNIHNIKTVVMNIWHERSLILQKM